MARSTRARASVARRIALTEYEALALPAGALSRAVGEHLWRSYGAQVRVAFPSPQTGRQWHLTAQGWVGTVPLAPDLTLDLLPRVPLAQLFTLLDLAWDLADLRVVPDVTAGDAAPGFFGRLAWLLARRTLALLRGGAYQRYDERSGELPLLRGRLDARALSRHPWRADVPCTYHERTADCAENRVLLWTLHVILRSGLCTEEVVPTVRAAQRALAGSVTLTPVDAAALASMTYHRLNAAYRPLHALCRFILAHLVPALGAGDAPTIPFLVPMPRLFERAVAAWVGAHLPPALTLRTQQRIPLGAGELAFVADGVLADGATGAARAVFDTKYSATADPTTADIAQVVAYARALDCPAAWLIYPLAPTRPLDILVGETRVRSAAFDLARAVDVAGADMLRRLLD